MPEGLEQNGSLPRVLLGRTTVLLGDGAEAGVRPGVREHVRVYEAGRGGSVPRDTFSRPGQCTPAGPGQPQTHASRPLVFLGDRAVPWRNPAGRVPPCLRNITRNSLTFYLNHFCLVLGSKNIHAIRRWVSWLYFRDTH